MGIAGEKVLARSDWRSRRSPAPEPSAPRTDTTNLLSPPAVAREHRRPRPVAEEDTGGAILPVGYAREGLGADDEGVARVVGLEEARRDLEGVDEAGAARRQVEGGAAQGAQLPCTMQAVEGKPK